MKQLLFFLLVTVTGTTIQITASQADALTKAAGLGDVDAVKKLLASTHVDACDGCGKTPLYMAAYGRKPGVVQLLLEHRATVDSRDRKNRTPLMEATECTSARMLLDSKADVNAVDNDKRSALHHATYWSSNDHLVNFLLGRRADVNQQDRNGKTALDIAQTEAPYLNDDDGEHTDAREQVIRSLRSAGGLTKAELEYQEAKRAFLRCCSIMSGGKFYRGGEICCINLLHKEMLMS